MQNSKTWEVCETKCWFSKNANISHFTFKNGIRIARPKRHVRDLKMWRQFVRRDQFNLTERKNSHFWFRMNIFPKGGLTNDKNDFGLIESWKTPSIQFLKSIHVFEIRNSVTHSVLAVACAVRPRSNYVLFPRNYL